MDMATKNMPGCCVLSGKHVYDIVASFPDGHFLAGEPAKVGQPLDVSYDVYLTLVSGNLMRVSVHEDHLADLIPNMARTWENILAAFMAEIKVADAAVVVNKMTAQQANQKRQDLIKVMDDRPVGIFCIERTKARAQREKAARVH